MYDNTTLCVDYITLGKCMTLFALQKTSNYYSNTFWTSLVAASAYNAGDLGSVPGLGRSPGEGSGNPLQYSCLEIPWMEEPGRLQSRGHKESDTTDRLHFQPSLLSTVSLEDMCLRGYPYKMEVTCAPSPLRRISLRVA